MSSTTLAANVFSSLRSLHLLDKLLLVGGWWWRWFFFLVLGSTIGHQQCLVSVVLSRFDRVSLLSSGLNLFVLLARLWVGIVVLHVTTALGNWWCEWWTAAWFADHNNWRGLLDHRGGHCWGCAIGEEDLLDWWQWNEDSILLDYCGLVDDCGGLLLLVNREIYCVDLVDWSLLDWLVKREILWKI